MHGSYILSIVTSLLLVQLDGLGIQLLDWTTRLTQTAVNALFSAGQKLSLLIHSDTSLKLLPTCFSLFPGVSRGQRSHAHVEAY